MFTRKKIASAVIAYLVALISALLALWSQPEVEQLSDINQIAYVIALLGPLVSVLKDLQSSMRDSRE